MSETDAEQAVDSAAPDDAESSRDEVDLAKLLDDEAFVAALGREFGAAVGREFGAVVGRAVEDRLRERIQQSDGIQQSLTGSDESEGGDGESSGRLARLAQWLAAQVSEILDEQAESEEAEADEASQEPDVGDESEGTEEIEDPDESERDVSAMSEPDDGTDQPEVGDDDAEPEAGEDVEEPETSEDAEPPEAGGDEASEREAESEGDGQDPAEVFEQLDVDETPESANELRDLSYRQLQSVAKKVGVKANLSRDELTTKVADELGFDAEA
ncbi:hypothetical protein [Natronoarchaeum rubrum]|uniref:hypothetical protein n=1 Tax=Natronoarchaeum rubrum TaxID=755311 RepID=UPI002112C342|nr:hypothetical protein [Natronoarchaeum rubrum]